MRKVKQLFRSLYNKYIQKKIKNTNFSVIASNCNGGILLHDLGIRFNSPFINLWMKPDDYIKFCSNIKHYLACDLLFCKDSNASYPVGILDDIYIFFQHYKTNEEALRKWNERKKRINFDNLFFMFTDRDGCTYQNLCDFEALPYKNKVVFTHVPYPEFNSAFYLKGWEKEKSVGKCYGYKNIFSIRKHYDDFDYVEWFNKGC